MRYYRIRGDAIEPDPDPCRPKDRPRHLAPGGLVARHGNVVIITRFVAVACGEDEWGDPLVYETLVQHHGSHERTMHATAQEAIAFHCHAAWSIGEKT